MGSVGTSLHRDRNAMGVATTISPRVPSTCAQDAILSLLIIRDCKVIGKTGNISPCIPSTCAQNAILALPIIHIIPSHQIHVAIDNPSFVPSVSCLTTGSYLLNDVRAADNISHTDHLQRNCGRCFLTCTIFKTGVKLPEFSGIVVSARANQYSTKAPSS
jgi:hypothetical protein